MKKVKLLVNNKTVWVTFSLDFQYSGICDYCYSDGAHKAIVNIRSIKMDSKTLSAHHQLYDSIKQTLMRGLKADKAFHLFVPKCVAAHNGSVVMEFYEVYLQ